ncbi:capsule biosynthesis GfcC family protein [Idiomarina ramblicola]|uniref:Capsule biosynthesis GfcC-like C-terminal domain-containing protein n=1 Tax=Idiomarina ramblicola TaxID=263724 RepID=A0A432Z1Q1_9GAMM|nr:capsule biosynthesis GfcC family protein [Idiomarina ramblicola]RUO71801.1 hypothetical protein CWI78_04600 [Idiomarina ramblicola]
MSNIFLRLCGCLLVTLVASVQAAADTNQVTLDVAGEKPVTYDLPDNIRLGEVIERSLPNKNIYWPAARLGSKHLQEELERERLKLLMRLDDLKQYAQNDNRKALYGASSQVYKQVENIPLKAAYYLGIPWETIRVDVESNPRLNEKEQEHSHFLLTVHEYPDFYRLLGLTASPQGHSLPAPEKALSLKDIMSRQQLSSVADNSYLWVIAINGDVSYQPSASHNAQQASNCYTHNPKAPLSLGTGKQCFPQGKVPAGSVIFVGFAKSELPEQFTDINQQIVQLLKHHNYAQN